MQAVVFRSHPTFMTHLTSTSPRTIGGFLQAMIPAADNFKYMTPLYCFLLAAGILTARYRRNSFGGLELAVANTLIYALVLYMEAFRIIEGGQFETALQVEKILYFFVIETMCLWLLPRYRKAVVFFLAGSLALSAGYVAARYYKKSPLKKINGGSKLLTFERARGVRTSLEQAEELEALLGAVGQYTDAQDKIFVYPDMGSYYFLCQRGFVGRFPTATLSWMREDWHRELMQNLAVQRPKLIVLKVKLEDDYTKVYFKRDSNAMDYVDVVHFIDTHYDLVATTPQSGIYLIKK